MTDKNIFVYKLLLSLDVSDFSFFCRSATSLTPWKKISSFFSSNTPLSKLRSCQAPLFENLVRGSNPQQKGGGWCTLWSCHIILLDWLYFIIFLHLTQHLLLLSNQNQSISIPYPNQAYDKQREKKFSVVISVCCGCIANVMLWNIYFPGLCFPAFYGF